MPTSCPAPEERARKSLAIIFQKLSSVGQAVLAEQLSVSEASVSRWKSEHADFAAKVLSVLGLKVVPVEMRCFDPKQIDAILHLAKAQLASIESTDQLALDE